MPAQGCTSVQESGHCKQQSAVPEAYLLEPTVKWQSAPTIRVDMPHSPSISSSASQLEQQRVQSTGHHQLLVSFLFHLQALF